MGRKYDDEYVILEDLCVNNTLVNNQIWKKGQPNAEGYFILEISEGEYPRIMTATSSNDIKIKGIT